MNYREKRALFIALEDAMQQGDPAGALHAADALYAAGPTERRCWEAVLAAYIDGGEKERALTAAAAYAEQFAQQGWGAFDGVAHFLIGRAMYLAGDAKDAEAHFQAALADEDFTGWYRGATYSIYATLCRELGRAAEAAALYRQSIAYKDLAHGQTDEYSNLLFNLHYLAKPAPYMFEAAKGYGALFQGVKPYTYQPHAIRSRYRKRGGRLRIGLISPDFRRHVMAFFSYALFHDYDARLYEIYAYTNCIEDGVSAELRNCATEWRNLRGLSPVQAAQVVHEDELDVLVDLAGHTGHNLLPVLAYRPAPVQISGIGYFATTGLPAIDDFLSDPYIDPIEPGGQGNDRYFTERLLRLPHSHCCYMWHDAPPAPAPAPFQKNGYVTFGSLNNFSKVTDEMLGLWAEILRQVPGSRLYLKAKMFDLAYGRELAAARLEAAGIEMARVRLEGFTPQYLSAYADIDIALDTYPYPGGGTTCDALYMGVPVVALVGERHGARFGYSILANAGLDELCAKEPEDYVRIAVSLAGDAARLRRYHQQLRYRLLASPVMDGPGYMAEMELAWNAAWLRFAESDLSARARQKAVDEDVRERQKAFRKELWPEMMRLAGRVIARTWLERDQDIPAETLAAAFYDAALARYAKGPVDASAKGKAAWWIREAIGRNRDQPVRLARLTRMLGDVEMIRNGYVRAEQVIRDCLTAIETCRKRQLLGELPGDLEANAWAVLGSAAGSLGQNERSSEGYLRSSELYRDSVQRIAMYDSYLLSEHFNTGGDAAGVERFNAAHLAYNGLFDHVRPLPAVSARALRARRAARPGRRLRIGYLSPDFRQQVMFYFSYQMIAGHGEAFEVYAYYLGKTHDGFTAQIAAAADHFVDLYAIREDHAAVARRIRDDGIDVLVELAGHCAGTGLPVLAYRPVPVQLSGLGYIHPTGLAAVDGFLTDAYSDPPAYEAEDWRGLHERPVRLTSQFCYTGRSDVPVPSGAPCRRKGYLTFGVFNRYGKINDFILSLWRQIMEAVPGSRLLLRNENVRDPACVLYMQEQLDAAGLDLDRVDMEDTDDRYMERYLDVDIALDTFPYVGGGTTCDALYMGVPVVSMYGRRHGTRLAYSILANVGLGELAIPSDQPQDYVARAVALAQDEDLLDVLHQNLRSMLLRSPVMDTQRYVAELEQVYREAWQAATGEENE